MEKPVGTAEEAHDGAAVLRREPERGPLHVVVAWVPEGPVGLDVGDQHEGFHVGGVERAAVGPAHFLDELRRAQDNLRTCREKENIKLIGS